MVGIEGDGGNYFLS